MDVASFKRRKVRFASPLPRPATAFAEDGAGAGGGCNDGLCSSIGSPPRMQPAASNAQAALAMLSRKIVTIEHGGRSTGLDFPEPRAATRCKPPLIRPAHFQTKLRMTPESPNSSDQVIKAPVLPLPKGLRWSHPACRDGILRQIIGKLQISRACQRTCEDLMLMTSASSTAKFRNLIIPKQESLTKWLTARQQSVPRLADVVGGAGEEEESFIFPEVVTDFAAEHSGPAKFASGSLVPSSAPSEVPLSCLEEPDKSIEPARLYKQQIQELEKLICSKELMMVEVARCYRSDVCELSSQIMSSLAA
eukprot:SM000071S21120  [mRNA]  locus=s71:656530:657899:+ [translate_table: standard]